MPFPLYFQTFSFVFSSKLYFFFLRSKGFQQIVFLLKVLFFLGMLVRSGVLLYQNLTILYDSIFSSVLPTDRNFMGGRPLPASPGPSPSFHSWLENSAERQSLLDIGNSAESEVTSTARGAGDGAGPSNQPAIKRNLRLESSIQQRIADLEKAQSPFLFEEKNGDYLFAPFSNNPFSSVLSERV
jgi:hypothetical protein